MSRGLPLHCIQTPLVLVIFILSVHPVKLTEATKSCLFLAIKQAKPLWLKMLKEIEKLEVCDACYQVNNTTGNNHMKNYTTNTNKPMLKKLIKSYEGLLEWILFYCYLFA